MAQILVAGTGNVFLGDDGFGPAVAAELSEPSAPPLPAAVRVVDYGIRGLHLTYDLLDSPDALIMIDAIPRGERAGELTVLQIQPEDLTSAGGLSTPLDAHSMDPVSVLAGVHGLGGSLPHTLLVGCRPANLSEGMGLSPPVRAAVGPAADLVRDLITELLSAAPTAAGTA